MQKTSYKYPVSQLNDLMAKHKTTPMYELIFHQIRHGVQNFMMRVTCPISSGGPPLSAEGWWGKSKKEAKHNAAVIFMVTFLSFENNKQPTTAQTDFNSAVDVHGEDICSKKHGILKAICWNKNLGEPEVEDIGTEGSSNALTFMAQCRVSDLCIRGNGKSKVEARLHAISRMIQILMETKSIHKISNFPQSKTSEIQSFALTSNSSESVSTNDNVEGSQLPVQNSANVERKMDVRSPQKPEDNPKEKEKVKLHVNPNRARTLLELMNARKKTGRIEDSNNNSASHVNLMHVGDNSNHKIFGTDGSSTLLNNNISNCANSSVVTTSSGEFQKNWTQLQAVSQIDRTLANLEKLLCDNILKVLVYSNMSHHQSVLIFSHDYQVFIHESSSQIFEGDKECTDQTIRVACLTKLLMNLKEHIQIITVKLLNNDKSE